MLRVYECASFKVIDCIFAIFFKLLFLLLIDCYAIYLNNFSLNLYINLYNID